MAKTLTADQAREHIAALQKFRTAYEAYLRADPSRAYELRRAVQRAMPSAQEAIDATGGGTVVVDPPAAGGRFRYQGLANTAFLHERPGFRLSQPPIYEAVLDDLDRAEATLEHHIKKLARDATEAERADNQPVFCRRGHFIGIGPEAPWFCEDCGAPAVSACFNCMESVSARGDPPRPPAFCAACGAAFPWVDRRARIYQLENLLGHEQLDMATELAVKEQLNALAEPDLSDDEQRERWARVRALAPGLWQSGRTILEGLVSAAIKAQLGL
jgi:hypothetical protein